MTNATPSNPPESNPNLITSHTPIPDYVDPKLAQMSDAQLEKKLQEHKKELAENHTVLDDVRRFGLTGIAAFGVLPAIAGITAVVGAIPVAGVIGLMFAGIGAGLHLNDKAETESSKGEKMKLEVGFITDTLARRREARLPVTPTNPGDQVQPPAPFYNTGPR